MGVDDDFAHFGVRRVFDGVCEDCGQTVSGRTGRGETSLQLMIICRRREESATMHWALRATTDSSTLRDKAMSFSPHSLRDTLSSVVYSRVGGGGTYTLKTRRTSLSCSVTRKGRRSMRSIPIFSLLTLRISTRTLISTYHSVRAREGRTICDPLLMRDAEDDGSDGL